MRQLVKPDPLIILIGGIVIVCGVLGLFEWLALTADQVAMLETGLIMVASAIRIWITRARGTKDQPVYGVDTEPGTGIGKTLALLPLFLLLAACNLPGTIAPTVAAVQDAVSHEVDPAAVELAKDTRCDAVPDTYDAALEALTVPIVEQRIVPGTMTAAPMMLLVPKGWRDLPEDVRLAGLREELAHYCQRRSFPGFDQLWLTGYVDRPCAVDDGKCVGLVLPRSDYRAAFEIAAKRAAGTGINTDRLVDRYLLHDLNRDSLDSMIWEAR